MADTLCAQNSFSLNRDSSKIKKERPGIPNTGLPRRSAFHF